MRLEWIMLLVAGMGFGMVITSLCLMHYFQYLRRYTLRIERACRRHPELIDAINSAVIEEESSIAWTRRRHQ